MLNNIFNDKTVLITGHTGFKGSWLSIWLSHLGAKVVGVSVDIPSNPSNFMVSNIKDIVEDHCIDIQDSEAIRKLIQEIQPDFVFHLAAQALVRESYSNPRETMITNAIGSVNVLDALRDLDKKVIAIMITSDKAYDNVEWAWGYRETDRLGGKDPYSASKGMAELAIRSYVESFFKKSNSQINIGIARAGNVIGGGDWAKDRIVPDCIKSWSMDKTVIIRSPWSTRPWQHVLEPLSGYISLAYDLCKNRNHHGEAYNFGPSTDQNHSVSWLIEEMSKYWEQVKWENASMENVNIHEAGLLKLNCDKALQELKWSSTLRFEETVKMTIEWYKHYYQNPQKSMYEFTIKQITDYTKLANSREISWART
jgi:CDP-glucose 4,6-dehydratase